jgi:hypothetical protein
MAKSATQEKRVNVSGTVSAALHEFIEEHRWANRMSKSDVINAALVKWGVENGFAEPQADAAPPADAPKAQPTVKK